MGTWDVGPFDNDTAADWSMKLDEAPADQREAIIRGALTAAIDKEGNVAGIVADEAIAAAAVVASQRPGGATITTPYGPDFLVNGGTLNLPPDLDGLAVRALDRVLADEEWRTLWVDSADYAEARVRLLAIRGVLAC